ncbi:MAG: serine/threonine-protein kinase [Pseudomonadota bacterium]
MEVTGYNVKRTIGKGGMGTVYLATQESLGRDVVLKTMSTAEAESSEFAERFLNEGRIVASIRHPHIITIYDIGRTEDVLYIAMEYVDGGDLKSRLNGAFPPSVCLELLVRIGSALEHAHEHGIIHRDVKPANILFRRDGTPLLSDFGIAKSVQLDSELTSTGTILGSPFYMSPEQSEGRKVDGRTDIYSLGVIFYEMLTGERPYEAESAIKIIMQHLQSPLPTLPADLERFQPLLTRLMAKDREERVGGATELVAEVEELQAREAVLNQPEVGERTQASVALHPPPGGTRRSMRAVWMTLGGVGLFAMGFMSFWLYARTLQSSTVVLAPPITATIGRSPVATAPSPSGTSAQPAAALAQPNPAAPPIQEVIRALEWLARNALESDRLTSPPADNAYYYYSRLLALDPNNQLAHQGFGQIAERYVVLAEQEYSRSNFRQSRVYIALGRQVAPGHRGLAALETFIDKKQETFWEGLMGFFRS